MSKSLATISLIAVLGTISVAPIIPVEMTWLVSYETVAFETSDGDLGLDEYAVKDNGEWYIREVPKNEGQFTSTTTEPTKKTRVKIRARKSPNNPDCVGCAYYSEFRGRDGGVTRVLYEGQYNNLKEIPNAFQPKRTERVSVLSGSKTEAAIAFDATSNSGWKGAVSSFSWSHTITGADTLLFVGVAIQQSVAETVSSVTYNSVALTSIRSDDNLVNHTDIRYLKAPTTGANTVAVTLSAAPDDVIGGAISLTGVDQTTPLDANNGATGTNNPSVSVTTVADNSWVLDTFILDDNSPTVGAGQTQRWNVSVGAFGPSSGGSTEGPKTPAGAVSMDWTSGEGANWAISAASFAPAGGAPPAAAGGADEGIIWFNSDE